ncbi:MAG: glycosyltransferase [Phycisphaerae bacterium]
MRITYLSTLYRGGGAERCARELFESVRAAGHETRMLVARPTPPMPAGVRPVRLPGEKYLRAACRLGLRAEWRHIGSALALRRVRPSDTDVLHLHNLHGGWMSIPAAARAARRIPAVWTLHDEWAVTPGVAYDLSRVLDAPTIAAWFGDEASLTTTDPRAKALARYLRPRLPRPELLIVPSAYLCDLASRALHLAGVPVKRIPYGVEMVRSDNATVDRAAARARFGIAPGARVVLLLAADLSSPYKGARLAVEVLAHLAALSTDVTVLLAGRNTAAVADSLRTAAGGDGRLRVADAGLLSGDGVLARAYRAADLSLVPSVADNFPYVALESLACATPVVSFAVGGMPEIVGDSAFPDDFGPRGLTAPPFDPAALADRTARVLADPDLRARLGDAGARWARARCHPAAALRANLDAYAEAIELRRRRATSNPQPG